MGSTQVARGEVVYSFFLCNLSERLPVAEKARTRSVSPAPEGYAWYPQSSSSASPSAGHSSFVAKIVWRGGREGSKWSGKASCVGSTISPAARMPNYGCSIFCCINLNLILPLASTKKLLVILEQGKRKEEEYSQKGDILLLTFLLSFFRAEHFSNLAWWYLKNHISPVYSKVPFVTIIIAFCLSRKIQKQSLNFHNPVGLFFVGPIGFK